MRTKTADFAAACTTVERDPDTVRRSAQALVFFTDEAKRAAHFI